MRVDAGRRPVESKQLALALTLALAGAWVWHPGQLSSSWAALAFFVPAVGLALKALAAPFVSHWLHVGPANLTLSARFGPFPRRPLGALPLEEGMCVRATPLGGRLPLDVEFAVEGPSGRLTWRAVGLDESARTQDRVLAALAAEGARLAAGRPGSFRGGRLQVRRGEGRLEISWPDDYAGSAWAVSLLVPALALAAAAASPRFALANGTPALLAFLAAVYGARLLALALAPSGFAPTRSTLVLTPHRWRYERRGLLARVAREGQGALHAGPGRTGPGPRRDVETGPRGRVTLEPLDRARAFEVGRSLTLRERRWLIELVERFHDVARPH